jgi:hypothetical protein
MLLRAREWHHELGDGITNSARGRRHRIKGLDRGRERWRRGSGQDSTTARRLQGGLDGSTGSGEVNDEADSR